MRSITDIAVKLARLSNQERWLLLQAWLLLLLADLALRLLPFSTVLRYFNPACRSCPADLSIAVARIAWLVEKAGMHCPTETSCLKEALVLSRLLSGRGIPATLRIGVGQQAESFAAHAWLEQDGQVILGGRNVTAYTPLLSRHS